jgi:hypothetical protein
MSCHNVPKQILRDVRRQDVAMARCARGMLAAAVSQKLGDEDIAATRSGSRAILLDRSESKTRNKLTLQDKKHGYWRQRRHHRAG